MATNWHPLLARVDGIVEMVSKDSFPVASPHIAYLIDVLRDMGTGVAATAPPPATSTRRGASLNGRRSMISTLWKYLTETDEMTFHTGLTTYLTIRNSKYGTLTQAMHNKIDINTLNEEICILINLCHTAFGYCGLFYDEDGSSFCICESEHKESNYKIAPTSLADSIEDYVFKHIVINLMDTELKYEFDSSGQLIVPTGTDFSFDTLSMALTVHRLTPSHLKVYYNHRSPVTLRGLFASVAFSPLPQASRPVVVVSHRQELVFKAFIVLRFETMTMTCSSYLAWDFEPP